jgi:circadian clock protein KaiC
LEEGGLKALSEMLRRETRAARATVLVVDDLLAVEESATTGRQLKKFVHELQVLAELVGCTVLLLTSASSTRVVPEHTMVDGVLELADHRIGKRSERELEITKFRGSSYLKGGHAFQINDSGLTVFPRLEGLLREPSPDDERRMERLPTGIEQLDRSLNGGLMSGSSTVVFGPTGVGKTSLGLHFLAGCSKDEPGLYFGFFETPERALLKARALGLELEAKKNAGTLSFCWYPPTERILDQLGNELVQTLRERRIKRLFVDGIDGFVKAAADVDRITQFMSALQNELRVLGVTTMYTHELKDLLSMQITLPVQGISSVCENMLLLRFLERRQQLVRTLVVVKLRDSGYDRSIRELSITDHGVQLGAPTQSGTSGSSAIDAALPRSPVARITRLLRRAGR